MNGVPNQERQDLFLSLARCAIVLFGMAGLAMDLGRMYITKNEAQRFADSEALYAAQQLNSTSAGLITSAQPLFAGTITEYSARRLDELAHFRQVRVANAANIRYVKVTPYRIVN